MSNFTYFSGIPNRPNKPSVDQPNMTINNNSNLGIWAIDHTGFNNNNNTDGYHKTIHQVPTNSSPSTIQNRMQIYSKPVTPAYAGAPNTLQLFTKNAYASSGTAGQESQLTGYIRNFNVASPFSNGWQWMGGILMQWGWVPIVNSGGNPSPDNGTVTFTTFAQGIPFPNKVMNVQCTATCPTPTPARFPATMFIDPTSFTSTGFKWFVSNSSWPVNMNGFMWMAIGY